MAVESAEAEEVRDEPEGGQAPAAAFADDVSEAVEPEAPAGEGADTVEPAHETSET
jgi:hypothetical protein